MELIPDSLGWRVQFTNLALGEGEGGLKARLQSLLLSQVQALQINGIMIQLVIFSSPSFKLMLNHDVNMIMRPSNSSHNSDLS